MKKPLFRSARLLLLCFLVFSLQSCFKEYTCMCPNWAGQMSSNGTMKAATKREAERACKVLGGDACIAEK